MTRTPQTCPECGLISPPESRLCDCGYDFSQVGSRPLGAQRDLVSTGRVVGAVAVIAAFVATRFALYFQWQFLVFVPVMYIVGVAVICFVRGPRMLRTAALAYGCLAIGVVLTGVPDSPGDLAIGLIYTLVVGAVPAAAGGLAGWSLANTWRHPGRSSVALAAISLAPLVLVMLMVVAVATDPKRTPAVRLRAQLLGEAPLGTSMHDVTGLVQKYGWELRTVDDSRGFYHQGLRPARVVGEKHIEAYAGHYNDLFRTDVVVYWGFDDGGRLIEVWVWKTTDAF